MDLIARGDARAEATRIRALPQGFLRRGEGQDGAGDRYDWDHLRRTDLIRKARLTKIPFGDGRMV